MMPAKKRDGNTENDKADHKISKGGDDEWNGFRFNNITIPAGAIVTDAYISFTSKDNKTGTIASTRFFGQDDISNAPSFANCNTCYDITKRSLTSNYVDWNNIASWSKNNSYNSPDISSIIQEIVDDQGGLSSSAVVIITQALPDYQERKTYSYDDDPSRSPQLHIEYAYPEPGLQFNYIIEIDQTSIPGTNPVVTTALQYLISFDSPSQSSCLNYYGIAVQACRRIFTNRFVRYNAENAN